MKVSFLITFLLLLIACNHTDLSKAKIGKWVMQKSGTSASLRGLSAVSSEVVWASGSNGTFLRTVDGGKTWLTGKVSGAESLDFRDVQGVDKNTAYLLSAGLPAKIFKTMDGGNNWEEQYSNNLSGVFFDAMDFWDADNGIAFSDPVDGSFLIIRTENGGKTWTQVPPENIPPPLEGEAGFAASGTCLAVQGKSNVWFGTGGSSVARVFRSTDKGITWEVFNTPMLSGKPSAGIFSLAFQDSKNGIAVGGDYKNETANERNAIITNDGGEIWELIEPNQPDGFRECVLFIPQISENFVLTVGPSGSDYSLDNGLIWTKMDTVGFHTFSFSERDLTGWACGADGKIAKYIGE